MCSLLQMSCPQTLKSWQLSEGLYDMVFYGKGSSTTYLVALGGGRHGQQITNKKCSQPWCPLLGTSRGNERILGKSSGVGS